MTAGPRDRDAIAAAVRAINDAWSSGRAEEMRELLEPDVVMVQAGFGAESRGADACIESYRDFYDGATIASFTLTEPAVEVFFTTAVAWIGWTMRYTWDGVESDDAGHDVYVFTRRAEGWRLAWRLLTTEPAAPATPTAPAAPIQPTS